MLPSKSDASVGLMSCGLKQTLTVLARGRLVCGLCCVVSCLGRKPGDSEQRSPARAGSRLRHTASRMFDGGGLSLYQTLLHPVYLGAI